MTTINMDFDSFFLKGMVSKSTRKVPQARKAIAKGAFLSIGWFTKLQFKLNEKSIFTRQCSGTAFKGISSLQPCQ